MFCKKLTVVLLSILLFGQNLAQTAPKPEQEKLDVSPELQKKAAGLLNNLTREVEQFALPKNRIVARAFVADLLWEHDEKQAQALYQSSITELNNLLQQIQPPDEDATDLETSNRYVMIYDLRNLRNELITAIAPRNPALALETLRTLTNEFIDSTDYAGENKALEISLAAEIARKDPKQAYELTKKNLEDGISYNLFTTLEDISKRDTELAAKLAKDIFEKITAVDTKISTPYDNTTNMEANIKMTTVGKVESFSVGTWDVQQFLTTVKKLNRQAAKDKKTTVLSDGDIKKLVEILAQKYIAQQYLSAYEVAPIMPELNKFFPAQAQAIRRKIGQNNQTELNNLVRTQAFENDIEDKPAEEVLQLIEKKPAAERDDLYWKAAEKAYNSGNTEKAREFYGKIKTKREYDYLDDRIKADLPLALAEKGDLRQMREIIAKLKTPEERIQVLTRAAETVAGNGDKKTAAALVEEARSLYSGKTKHRRNLKSILDLTHAYAAFEPEQGFALLEANLTFVNDVINAAILLEEFNESGAVEDDELLLRRVLDESYRYVEDGVVLIRDLSAADFERTTSFADKFSRPETRFAVRLRIAQALLDPNALEIEEKKKTQLNEEEHGDH